jgi:uncharacterized OsmC-like protein
MTWFKIVNGINADQLFQTIDLVKENPDLARFKFRAQNTWINGTHNRATVKDFYGALQEDDSREPMVFDLDEPSVLCGENKGANPVEYLLVALSGCLTTSLVVQAALKDITLEKISSRYEGDIDLRGSLGLSEEVPVSYQAIRVYLTIEADISEAQKEELVKLAQTYSPVYDTITKATPVSLHLEK